MARPRSRSRSDPTFLIAATVLFAQSALTSPHARARWAAPRASDERWFGNWARSRLPPRMARRAAVRSRGVHSPPQRGHVPRDLDKAGDATHLSVRHRPTTITLAHAARGPANAPPRQRADQLLGRTDLVNASPTCPSRSPRFRVGRVRPSLCRPAPLPQWHDGERLSRDRSATGGGGSRGQSYVSRWSWLAGAGRHVAGGRGADHDFGERPRHQGR